MPETAVTPEIATETPRKSEEPSEAHLSPGFNYDALLADGWNEESDRLARQNLEVELQLFMLDLAH